MSLPTLRVYRAPYIDVGLCNACGSRDYITPKTGRIRKHDVCVVEARGAQLRFCEDCTRLLVEAIKAHNT